MSEDDAPLISYVCKSRKYNNILVRCKILPYSLRYALLQHTQQAPRAVRNVDIDLRDQYLKDVRISFDGNKYDVYRLVVTIAAGIAELGLVRLQSHYTGEEMRARSPDERLARFLLNVIVADIFEWPEFDSFRINTSQLRREAATGANLLEITSIQCYKQNVRSKPVVVWSDSDSDSTVPAIMEDE